MRPHGQTSATALVVAMPKLSDSMQEGTLVHWLVADGASIQPGQEIAEIETDKATVAHEAEAAGVLEQIAREGETLPIGETIARILVPDGVSPPRPAASSSRRANADGNGEPVGAHLLPPRRESDRRANASPIAQRLAARLGIDIARVKGSGPQGRILKADVVAYQEPGEFERAAPVGRPAAKGAPTLEQPTRIQQLIARRMSESKATVPEFTLRTEVDMQRCSELRDDLKRELSSEHTAIPSFNDTVLKACALALRSHPRVNSSYRDGAFELHPRINIGVAVATADSLVVPTLFDADTKSLTRIASETRSLVERVRAGRVTPPELTGATFTVSNLGMLGVEGFDAVINPPQAAILAVGQVIRVPAVVGDQVLPRLGMKLSLTCDHRILYGADAASFLGDIKANLEKPTRLLISGEDG